MNQSQKTSTIWDLIGTNLERSAEPDPRDVARAHLRGMTDQDKLAYFGELLIYAYVVHNSRIRRRLTIPVQVSGSTPPQPSVKVAAIRNLPWDKILASRRNLGNQTWKVVGDMNSDDLITLERFDRDAAAARTVNAERWVRLRAALEIAGVKTVRELDRRLAQTAWTGTPV